MTVEELIDKLNQHSDPNALVFIETSKELVKATDVDWEVAVDHTRVIITDYPLYKDDDNT